MEGAKLEVEGSSCKLQFSSTMIEYLVLIVGGNSQNRLPSVTYLIALKSQRKQLCLEVEKLAVSEDD